MTAEPDALVARMDQIRRRLSMRNYTDSAALLAAVEAVLKLADEYRDTEYPDGDETSASDQWLAAAAIEARVHDGLAFRAAITSKLLSEGESDA
jgi:hypothetical protein